MKLLYLSKCIFTLLICFLLTHKSSAQDCRFSLPSVPFVGNSITLIKTAQRMLERAAMPLQNSPSCKLKVIGYCDNNKRGQQRSWDRVNAVIQYMVNQQGISESRFIFIYGQSGGNCNLIVLQVVPFDEEGPSSAPASNPNYSNKKP